jgi:hypothetical protein
MATTSAPSKSAVDITAAPRVVITLASGLVTRMFDLSSARDNAWQSVLADRERAAQRAELDSVLRRSK